MAKKAVSDEEIAELIEAKGLQETARITGLNIRTIYRRRDAIENRIGRQITSPESRSRHAAPVPGRLEFTASDATIIIGSDAHFWPHDKTAAFRAFVKFAKDLKPKFVVLNGDTIDGSSISRHPPMGWEWRPTVKEELDVTKERLDEIEAAAKNAFFIWTIGNHCLRFSARLANSAREFEGVIGFDIQDHFPKWQMCWEVWFNPRDNGPELVVTHRFKGGANADRLNALWTGRSISTGHTHKLRVSPHSDLTGTRYGIESGMLSQPYGPQFGYTERNPVNWQSGFIVATLKDGRLIHPEPVHVLDDETVEFRGKRISV